VPLSRRRYGGVDQEARRAVGAITPFGGFLHPARGTGAGSAGEVLSDVASVVAILALVLVGWLFEETCSRQSVGQYSGKPMRGRWTRIRCRDGRAL